MDAADKLGAIVEPHYIAQDLRAADRRKAPMQRNAVSPISVAANWMPLPVVDGVVICIGLERAHPAASALTIPGERQPPGTADCAHSEPD